MERIMAFLKAVGWAPVWLVMCTKPDYAPIFGITSAGGRLITFPSCFILYVYAKACTPPTAQPNLEPPIRDNLTRQPILHTVATRETSGKRLSTCNRYPDLLVSLDLCVCVRSLPAAKVNLAK